VAARFSALLALLIVGALEAGQQRATAAAQQRAELPQALSQMLEAERAFAARALVVGWKAAFLEYFADNALGFERGHVGLARDQINANPDPPKDHRLIWEPRYGDVAASGELGYLIGPVRSILPSRDNGRPRHSTYTSIWKRERNGTFKVVIDVDTSTPAAVPFAAGFTRAANADRFTGDYDDSTPPLSAADGVLNSGLRSGQAAAYRGRLAAGARFNRPNILPIVGERNVTRWLASQPVFTVADSRYAEAARSGDMGYTWGAYAIGPRQKPTQQGIYVRVWERERKGQWKIAVDILQPR
jgi:ketosteroid isomerase-like protein